MGQIRKPLSNRLKLVGGRPHSEAQGRWRYGIPLFVLLCLALYFLLAPDLPMLGRQEVVAMPATGMELLVRQNLSEAQSAPLKLQGDREGRHCIFRLEDRGTGQPVIAVFVRAAEAAQTRVPLGQYRAEIVCGSKWHGSRQFGSSGTTDQVDQVLVFKRNADGSTTGLVIDLTKTLGGNLKTTRPLF